MESQRPICKDCGVVKPKPPKGSCSTGYGTDKDGDKICFDCIGWRDLAEMLHSGKSQGLPLYLSMAADRGDGAAGHTIANWPGSLKFRPLARTKGAHNIAGTRKDVWFRGPDGFIWHGVQYGEWTEVVHCKRTRKTRLS